MKILDKVIDLTSTEWPATSSRFDDTLLFGFAMDIVFPEVIEKCLNKTKPLYIFYSSACTLFYFIFVHIAVYSSLMEADGLSYEETSVLYYS